MYFTCRSMYICIYRYVMQIEMHFISYLSYLSYQHIVDKMKPANPTDNVPQSQIYERGKRECKVWSVKWRVQSGKCKVWSVKCGVGSVKCGV